MWRLFYPLRYFRIANTEKRHIDLWPTLFLTIIIAVPFIFVPGTSFFKPNGFLANLVTGFSALTGFYVAALVAAATFSHPDLDKTITAGPIALVTKNEDGEWIKELLTRREFICTIFGYLAFATFAIVIFSALLTSISGADLNAISKWKWVGVLFHGKPWVYLRDAIVVLFSLAVSHVAVATALGIYYLMDRMYRRDRKITTPKKSGEAA